MTIIVTRRSVRDEVYVYYDVPADKLSWDGNALLIASEYGIALDEAHRMLERDFPHVYAGVPFATPRSMRK